MSREADDLLFLTRLSNGKATQDDRDKALFEAIVEVRTIRRELWKPDDLVRFIREQHQELCNHCTKASNAPIPVSGVQDGKDEGSRGALMFVLKLLAYAGAAGFVIALLCMGVKFAEIVSAASQVVK